MTMRILIAEDDLTCRLLMQQFLKDLAPSDIAVNGKEAVDAVRLAMDNGTPYNLICLDIMMPEMDGHEALRQIRGLEEDRGIGRRQRAKILMTTALSDIDNVNTAFTSEADGYLTKPIQKAKLLELLRRLKLIP
jgi:two-component system chemotaxis response regulator CheY